MLKLTEYTPEMADAVASWVTDENTFYLWSAGRFGGFPITGDRLNEGLSELSDTDGLVAFAAFDENGIAGMFTVRRGKSPGEKRLGFIILNPEKRGLGYGREMLCLAKEMLFADPATEKLTLGVFDTNLPAVKCYTSLGFRDTGGFTEYIMCGKVWRSLEFELKKAETAR